MISPPPVSSRSSIIGQLGGWGGLNGVRNQSFKSEHVCVKPTALAFAGRSQDHTEHVRKPADSSVQSEGSLKGESPAWGWDEQLRGGDGLWEQVVVGGQGDVCRRDHLTWNDRSEVRAALTG